MTGAERKALTKVLLAHFGPVGRMEKRPFEVTVVFNAAAAVFPSVCEYMYGEWLRGTLESGKIPGAYVDPDLALLLWQAQTYGEPLYGGALCTWIEPVSPEMVRRAIAGALPALLQNPAGDERNVLLTLARKWFTLETGRIAAKDEVTDLGTGAPSPAALRPAPSGARRLPWNMPHGLAHNRQRTAGAHRLPAGRRLSGARLMRRTAINKNEAGADPESLLPLFAHVFLCPASIRAASAYGQSVCSSALRICARLILPPSVFGSSCTYSITRGYLYGAVTRFTWFCSSFVSAGVPS